MRHPERSEAKSKDLYGNNDDIYIEIPRGARDDRSMAAFLRPPRGAAALHTLFMRGLFYVLHLFADLFDLVFEGEGGAGDL